MTLGSGKSASIAFQGSPKAVPKKSDSATSFDNEGVIVLNMFCVVDSHRYIRGACMGFISIE